MPAPKFSSVFNLKPKKAMSPQKKKKNPKEHRRKGNLRLREVKYIFQDW